MNMTKKTIEDRLIRSMRQAVEIARGTAAPDREYDLPLTAKNAKVPAAPSYTKHEVIAIRKKLKLSQAVFAQALNVSPGTVRSWEQGAKPPQGPSRRLLEIASRSPAAILQHVVFASSADAILAANRSPRTRAGADRRSGTDRRHSVTAPKR